MPEAARLGGVWRVGDRLIAGTFGPTTAAWYEILDDEVRPLSGGTRQLEIYDVRGSELFAVLRPDGAAAVASLVAIDRCAERREPS